LYTKRLSKSSVEIRDEEAKAAGLTVLLPGQVYERQLDHQRRPKEVRDYHLFIQLIDGQFVCYWRSYANSIFLKEKVVARGSWKKVLKRAKSMIKWWDNKRKKGI